MRASIEVISLVTLTVSVNNFVKDGLCKFTVLPGTKFGVCLDIKFMNTMHPGINYYFKLQFCK